MHQVKEWYKVLKGMIHNMDSQVAALSAFLAGLVSVFIALTYFVTGQGGREVYTDIVYDYLAIDGAYKGVDTKTFYLLLFSFVILFLLLYRYFWKKHLKFDVGIYNNEWILIVFPIVFYFVIRKNYIAGLALALAVIYFANAHIRNIEPEKAKKGFFAFLYIYLSVTGLKSLIQFTGVADLSAYTFLIQILIGILLLVFALFSTRISEKGWRFLSGLQIVIPCNILGIINTKYLYQGNEIELPSLMKFRHIIISLWVILEILFLCQMCVMIKKQKRNGLAMTTVISMLGILAWNCNYDLLINTDTFHMGETAVVYNQVVNLGQGYGTDFSSIMQGLGFLLSGINEWLFDGKFAMYVQSQNFLLLGFSVILGILGYLYAKDNVWFCLYLVFIPALLMDRAYMIVITFLVLMNRKLIGNAHLWTLAFVALCIANVFYQPTYGGAVCASMLIPLVYIWWVQFKKSQQTILKFLTAKSQIILMISLVVIGILCIPLLHQAIVFLADNARATETANGITILQSAKYFNGAGELSDNKYLNYFVMYVIRYGLGPLVLMGLFYYFIVYKNKVENQTAKIQIMIVSVSGIVSYVLMLSASFNRIDSGISRIGNINCIFSALLVILVLLLWKHIPNKMPAGLLIGIMCFCGLYVNGFPLFEINEKVSNVVELPEDAVFIKEEEHGLKNLGDVFTDNELYVYEAKVLKEFCTLLLNEEQTYYDCLDKSIYYNYTNRLIPGYHVAQYTIGGNTFLQEKAISNLQKYEVPVIFVKGIESTNYISQRCYLMYRYFMNLDYKLIQYKGCHFLVDSNLDLAPIEQEINKTNWDWLVKHDEFEEYIEKIQKSGYAVREQKSIKLENLGKNDVAVIEFNNTEEIAGVLSAEINGEEVSTVIHVAPGESVTLPAFLSDNISVTLSDSLKKFAGKTQIINISKNYEANFQKDIIEVLDRIEMDELNEDFRKSSVGYTAEEWGTNFENMAQKFSYTSDKTRSVKEKDLGVYTIECRDVLKGEDAEFLYMQLENPEEKIAATLIVNGTDKNGDEFSESIDVSMKYQDSQLLIPLGISPDTLLAKDIDSIEVRFSKSDVEIDKVSFYKMNDFPNE